MKYNISEHLEKFLNQTQTGSLKYATYPKNYKDLEITTSFGQGGVSKIPWISFLADGMKTSDGFYPVYLYYKDLNILILSFGESETYKSGNWDSKKSQNNSSHRTHWSNNVREKNPTIKDFFKSDKVYRYGDSFVFKAYRIEFGFKEIDDVYKKLLNITYYNKNQELEELVNESDLSSDLNSIYDIYINDLSNSHDLKEEWFAFEGGKKLVTHYMRERSTEIVKAKKEQFKKRFGSVYCQICDFNFQDKYGDHGEGFIECHHIIPVSEMEENHKTELKHLILLCANCHRMIHRNKKEALSPQTLINKIK